MEKERKREEGRKEGLKSNRTSVLINKRKRYQKQMHTQQRSGKDRTRG
jgi:hypothetical protein